MSNYLVHTTYISPNDERFHEIDQLCFATKNLYNSSLYAARQKIIKEQDWSLTKSVSLYHEMKNSKEFRTETHEINKYINTKVLKVVYRQLEQNFTSFF